jgi:hypothetical protein
MRKFLQYNLVSFALILSALNAFAQSYPPGVSSTFEYTAHIKTELNDLEKLEASQFLNLVDRYRVMMERYFDHKKRVCEGEFSSLILSTRGEGEGESRVRISREERQLCMNELKALQSTYINALYGARERFLLSLHEQRLKDLQGARAKALEDLEASFQTRRR